MNTIIFPHETRVKVLAFMREIKQAEAVRRGAEHKADLVIDATATALGVPDGWQLDVSGDVWQFVPPPADETILEMEPNNAQAHASDHDADSNGVVFAMGE